MPHYLQALCRPIWPLLGGKQRGKTALLLVALLVGPLRGHTAAAASLNDSPPLPASARASATPAPLVVPPALEARQQERQELIDRVRPTVVAVFGPAGEKGSQAGGSGVLLTAQGLTLTNFHVVQGQGPALRAGLPDGQVYDAVLLGLDPVGDLALIQLLGRDDFPAARWGDSDALQVGDEVLAAGNPFLLAMDFQPTFSLGIVSGLHRYQYPADTFLEYTDCIQTDAPINPGNSGGPLFDRAGKLVGINGRISLEKRGRVSVGVGYAITATQAQRFLDHLRGGLIADHGNLGAAVRAEADGRIVIDAILPSSEAARRGLQLGDELVSFADRPLGSVNQFKNVLGLYPAGWPVPLTYRRDEQKTTIRVRLGSLHSESEMATFAEAGGPKVEPKNLLEKMVRAIPTLPAAVAAKYEARAGFANYRANRLEREAWLQGWRQQTHQSDLGGKWRLLLTDEGGKTVVWTLADVGVSWQREGEMFARATDDATNLDPPQSGGLLLTLELWRRLQTDPARSFSRIDFAGGFPDPAGVIQPTLESLRGQTRTQWLFDRETGLLRMIYCEPQPQSDGCEVHLSDYRPLSEESPPGEAKTTSANDDDKPAAGQARKGKPTLLPHRWEVWHAGQRFGQYTLHRAELAP